MNSCISEEVISCFFALRITRKKFLRSTSSRSLPWQTSQGPPQVLFAQVHLWGVLRRATFSLFFVSLTALESLMLVSCCCAELTISKKLRRMFRSLLVAVESSVSIFTLPKSRDGAFGRSYQVFRTLCLGAIYTFIQIIKPVKNLFQ